MYPKQPKTRFRIPPCLVAESSGDASNVTFQVLSSQRLAMMTTCVAGRPWHGRHRLVAQRSFCQFQRDVRDTGGRRFAMAEGVAVFHRFQPLSWRRCLKDVGVYR